MRSLALCFLFLCCLLLLLPVVGRPSLNVIDPYLAALFPVSRLEVEGISVLTEKDILTHLPLERSQLWWRTSQEVLAARLLENPLVKSVEIELSSCEQSSFEGCVVVRVEERNLGYAVRSGPRAAVLDDEGDFIRSASAALIDQVLSGRDQRLPRVIEHLGCWPGESVECAARLRGVIDGVELLEQELQRRVRLIELTEDGGSVTRFDSLDFDVQFAGIFDLKGLVGQAKRLSKLLPQVTKRALPVERITMGFGSLGVVTVEPSSEVDSEGEDEDESLSKS